VRVPIYEYYCRPCNGVFELLRPVTAASRPQPCPECDEDTPRIVSKTFSAFTLRDGLPRRLPDTGGYWHFEQSVSSPINGPSYQGVTHPELTPYGSDMEAPSVEEIERWEQVLGERRAVEAEIDGTVIDSEFERAKSAFAERMTAVPASKPVEKAKKRLVQTDMANVRKVHEAKERRAR
jgi:putative FmdB family regulatory protein